MTSHPLVECGSTSLYALIAVRERERGLRGWSRTREREHRRHYPLLRILRHVLEAKLWSTFLRISLVGLKRTCWKIIWNVLYIYAYIAASLYIYINKTRVYFLAEMVLYKNPRAVYGALDRYIYIHTTLGRIIQDEEKIGKTFSRALSAAHIFQPIKKLPAARSCSR